MPTDIRCVTDTMRMPRFSPSIFRILSRSSPKESLSAGKLRVRGCCRRQSRVVFTAVLAFAVVMRNSQIYQNNRSIQQIGAGISQATDELNAAKQRLSAMEDVEEYLNRADGELDMTFPGEGEYRVINITPAEEVGTEDNVLAGNGSIIDAVLDWLNSLERRT